MESDPRNGQKPQTDPESPASLPLRPAPGPGEGEAEAEGKGPEPQVAQEPQAGPDPAEGQDRPAGSDPEKCWVLVPAYRPDRKLVALAQELSSSGLYARVLVVDDGSPPECEPFFEAVAALPGTEIVRHAVNRGKGQALKTGLNRYLLGSDPRSKGIVACDADGQHLPADVAKVCGEGARAGRFALGVREFVKGTPLRSLVGNMLTRFFFALFTGYRVRDTQTGLRFIPRRQAGFFIRIPYDRFDYEFAALMDASSELKGDMLQIPVETVYIDGNASSHYRGFRDSLTVCRVFLRFLSLAVTSTLLDYAVFIALFYGTRRLLASFVIARVVSILFNFHFARFLVFKVQTNYFRQLVKYLALAVVVTGISYFFTKAVSERLHGFEVLAKAVAEGSLFYLSFIIQKRFIMVKKKSEIA